MSDISSSAKTARKGLPGKKPQRPRPDPEDGEVAVLAKIAAMPDAYRPMGERLHALIMSAAPSLTPRLWYGMPAYAKDGKTVCFFRGAEKERYMTLGFTEAAALDDAAMWPTSYAITQLTSVEESKIALIVKMAVS